MFDSLKLQSALHKVSSGLAVAGVVVGTIAATVGSLPLPQNPAGWVPFGLAIFSAISGAFAHAKDAGK